MSKVSALTLAAGRADHLRNVLLGFDAQRMKPCEIVIGVMQDEFFSGFPEVAFPIRQIRIARQRGELALAAARNAVAEAARGDVLAFVDVDCIPSPDFVQDYAQYAVPGAGVMMGEVGYLPAGATSTGLDYDRFAALAVRHSDRRGPPQAMPERCIDYRCFWSLNFALHRHDWRQSGGFDPRFYGYGGEDTDFARSLDKNGIPLWWVKGGKVYHQYHTHCMPPIHHLASVLRNADLFAEKWGHRTMEHWLHGFRMMGLIENRGGVLRVLREADEADFALCRQAPEQPYANTRRVLDKLQAIEMGQTDEAARRAEIERQQSDLLGLAAE